MERIIKTRGDILNFKENIMAKPRQEIISDISNYVSVEQYSDYYVGITSDIDSRLFGDHNVSKKDKRLYIHSPASDHLIAREIENYFIAAGMDGKSGGGDISSNIVYVYKKTSYTKP